MYMPYRGLSLFYQLQQTHQQMIEDHQGEEPHGSRCLLPPVRLYARRHVSSNTIKKILNFAKEKKQQLQESIHEQEQETDELQQVQLNYVQSGPFEENRTSVRTFDNPAIEEEMLARGSIDEWVQTDRPKGRLFTKQFHLESTGIDISRSRLKIPFRDEFLDTPLISKKFQRCLTQPTKYESTSIRKKVASRQKRYDYTGRTVQEEFKEDAASFKGNKDSRVVVYQKPLERKSDKSTVVNKSQPSVYEFPKAVSSKKVSRARSSMEDSNFRLPYNSKSSKKHRTSSVSSHYQRMVPLESSPKLMKFQQAIYILQKSSKTNQRLERTVMLLEGINCFFKRINRVIGVCLLRIGKIMHKYPQNLLYQMDMPYTHFFMLLSGKIKLFGKDNMHKICETGQTLLQELIFDTPANGTDPISSEKAKVVQESWLLKIQLTQLGKLQRELVKYGFKQGLVQLKSLIKRNNIVKNWVRNKYKLLQNI